MSEDISAVNCGGTKSENMIEEHELNSLKLLDKAVSDATKVDALQGVESVTFDNECIQSPINMIMSEPEITQYDNKKINSGTVESMMEETVINTFTPVAEDKQSCVFQIPASNEFSTIYVTSQRTSTTPVETIPEIMNKANEENYFNKIKKGNTLSTEPVPEKKIKPIYNGNELNINSDILESRLSILSVKGTTKNVLQHRRFSLPFTASECHASILKQSQRHSIQCPEDNLAPRYSYRNIFQPDLSNVECLKNLGRKELEEILEDSCNSNNLEEEENLTESGFDDKGFIYSQIYEDDNEDSPDESSVICFEDASQLSIGSNILRVSYNSDDESNIFQKENNSKNGLSRSTPEDAKQSSKNDAQHQVKANEKQSPLNLSHFDQILMIPQPASPGELIKELEETSNTYSSIQQGVSLSEFSSHSQQDMQIDESYYTENQIC
ncbi:uncharacterized protein LOC111085852 [Limulus polyphemus]|uniref:Uncharacterized protein LOC111085852 n=1 Tax=Limulus polyphemus TaxID=6850 RepID=A0ABM1SEK5_LIMPO|nr:uncharacterized protein LOC111085852 [Limulus polyphemus]XP_022242059.1 uncharacterized protein LOC111085852 [Limulus polyphemus]XP_022242060.1 uncharacterized protein LOC111085852 [Limulus polyphemus]